MANVEIKSRPVDADSFRRTVAKGDIILNPGAINGFVTSKSSAATLTEDEKVVFVDTSGGAITITLPSGVEEGQVFIIKNTGSATNNVTVDTEGSETIDGSASITVADGTTAWLIADSSANFFDIN